MNIKEYKELNAKVDGIWKAYSTDVRQRRKAFNDEDASLDQLFKEVLNKGNDENVVTGEERDILLKPSESYGTKIGVAQRVLAKLGTKIGGSVVAATKGQAHTQGKFAKSSLEALEDEKLELAPEDVANIEEAMWYAAGTPDKLSQETIKEALIAKKKTEGEAEEPTQEELRQARSAAIRDHYRELIKDENWATASSNSAGDLYEVEGGIISLAALAKSGTITKEAKEKISEKLTEIGEKVPAVGALMRSGQGAQFFTDPKGYLSSRIAGAIASKVAANAAVNGLLTVVAGMTGPFGVIARAALALAQRFLGQALGVIVNGVVDRGVKSIKYALASLAGFALFLGGALGAGAAVGAAAAGATAIVLAPLVALILFIINAGGWVVPPGPPIGALVDDGGSGGNVITGSGSKENDYIRVTKIPNPAGPFQNSQLPFEVSYAIEIVAKKVTLTNIELSYGCDVIKINATINCPNPSIPVIEIERAPIQIVPGTPYVVRYSATYNFQFTDSIVRDSLTVRATAEGIPGTQSASGVASVIFGEPKTECLVFGSGWGNSPVQKNMMYSSLGLLLSQKNFISKLCSGGSITLINSPTNSPNGFYGQHYPARSLTFFPPAFNDQAQLNFILAHESGHALQYDTPDSVGASLFRDFKASVPGGYICSYPPAFRSGGNAAYVESFAEMIGLYIVNSSASTTPRTYDCFSQLGNKDGTFKGAYPEHWNFANTKIF